MARPVHKPDASVRRQVEAMAGYGVPEAEIAGVVGVSPKTLRKHYRGELDHGHVKANTKVAENLYRKATGDGREAVIAAIFWLKTRAGWKETSVSEVRHDVVDPIRELMLRIATNGQRIVPTGEAHRSPDAAELALLPNRTRCH
jgi:predicted transcriptional regulator